jgi:hypothetical protein
MHVIRVEPALMISGEQVAGCETLGSMQLVEEHVRTGERITILYSDSVQFPIVDAETE